MATITITIPDAIAQRVLNGFSQRYGYQPLLENGTANPETKAQFCKRKITEIVKVAVRESEMNTAINAASKAAADAAESEIQMT